MITGHSGSPSGAEHASFRPVYMSSTVMCFRHFTIVLG
jgi:hypothetical protein